MQVFAQEPIQPFSFPPIIFQVFHRCRSLIKCKRNQPTGFENMACFLACFDKIATLPLWLMVHFTVVCLVYKPLNRSEARDDLVMIQELQRIKCKLLCYHVDTGLSITTRSPSASLQIKGLVTKYTNVK